MRQVRWDAAVADRGFWSITPRDAGAAAEAAPLRVEVQLFGALADRLPARRFLVELPQGGALRDVVQEVARRAGPEFAARALDAGGALKRCCRAFVDGEALEDVHARIGACAAAARVELILLTAAEGG